MSSQSYDFDDDDDYDYRRGRISRYNTPYSSRDRPRSFASGALPVPHKRLQYEPGPSTSNALQGPVSRSRPRSVPPIASGIITTRRRDSRSSSTSPHHRSHSPLHALKANFTDSPSGVGVAVLGALVGGLAAREVSRRRHNREGHDLRDQQKSEVVTTVIGATVGAVGANVLERRLENMRERDREKEAALEQKLDRDRHRASSGRHKPPRRRGTAADYYDVEGGYDYVFDKPISRRRSEDFIPRA